MPKVFSSFEMVVDQAGCGCGGGSTSKNVKGFRITDGATIQGVAAPFGLAYTATELVVQNNAVALKVLLSETAYGSTEELAAQVNMCGSSYTREFEHTMTGSGVIATPTGIYLPDPGGFFSAEHLARIIQVQIGTLIGIRGLHYQINSTTELEILEPPFNKKVTVTIKHI